MPNCMSHCSSAEALADYAALVPLIKADYNATNSPVISFGGSYGGTSKQSTWFCGRAPQERSASSNLHKDKTHSTQLFLLFLFFSFLFPFRFLFFLSTFPTKSKGMLSAYFRIKYPNVVDGAIAVRLYVYQIYF